MGTYLRELGGSHLVPEQTLRHGRYNEATWGFSGSDCDRNGGGRTERKAEEKYNIQMSMMENLCVRDAWFDLMLM